MEKNKNRFSRLRALCRASAWDGSLFSPMLSVTAGILALYAVYTLLRVEYLLENYSCFAPSVGEGHLWRLLWGGVVMDTPGIMYTNALWILLVLLPLHYKERRGYHLACRWLYVVVNGVCVAASLADSVYFRFTLRRTTSSVFAEFAGEDNLGAILGVELLRHWYLVLLFLVLVCALWRLYLTPRPAVSGGRRLALYYGVQTVSLVVAGVLCVSGIRGGLLRHWWQYVAAFFLCYAAWRLWRGHRRLAAGAGIIALLLVATAPLGGWRYRDIRPIALGSANEYTYRPTEVALVLGTPFSVIRTWGKAVFTDPGYYPDKAALERLYTPLHRPAPAAPMRRKNVVVIIIESFGREYIGSLASTVLGPGYRGYTPFTDSLARASATFRYSFCNGRKSIDGMPSILSGIPMFVKPFVLTPQSMNRVSSLAGYLGDEGWQSAFFHGARTGSMGFNGFARAIGFQHYYGREDFDSDPRFGGERDFDGYWAIWDEPFMQYFATKMGEMREPFVTALFTASSHHPFRIPEAYRSRCPEGPLPIHKCIRYTDHALQQFFATARRQKWYANTIFVITSDHTNLSDHPEFSTDLGGFCSPIIIYDPSGDIRPGMRESVAQQTDILPTMLGHLGYPRPYIAFGKDLLQTPAGDTWAVNYLNGVYQYCRYGHVLQWDGQRTVGLYRLDDHLMRRNLRGDAGVQPRMEREVKAIIQQYMDRMTGDRLVPGK